MFRPVCVVLTRNEGHDMTGYFLRGPGHYIVGAKFPHHSEQHHQATVAFELQTCRGFSRDLAVRCVWGVEE